MKKLIFAGLCLISFGHIYAQTPSPQILDTEKDIINDLAFAPAESNRSLNNGQMIELTECVFHGQGLPGSKPKTRVLKYTLWYYGSVVSSHNQPTGGRRVTYEIDMRQQLRLAYQNNSLVITCSNVNGRVTEGSNVQSLKVITIPDVTANSRYANMATTLQVKFAALKVHIDRFYR
ncbi:MAG: hypothetical protein MUE85_04890 [Microscillaceae bacterium]|jgi:hypothetical protein|nr:hypothetical protein [Microscillaceae bacterium]